MNEARGLLEEALQASIVTLLASNNLACPVVRGDSEGERPDEYVSVVAGSASARAPGVYLIQTEVRIVAPMDDAALAAKCRSRLRVICDYLDNPLCAFRTLDTPQFYVCGYHLYELDAQKGSRTRAEIVKLKIGAAAKVDTTT
jgi:hypothetical protein